MAVSRTLSPKSFFYIASGPGGKQSFGIRQAKSRSALAGVLRQDRLTLTSTVPLPGWIGSEGKLPLKDLTAMNEQLEQLVGRGVPLVEALDVVRTVVSKGQQNRIHRVRELVAGGASLADACQTAGGVDRVTTAIYRAAEKTGDLSTAAGQLALNARRTQAVAGKAATLAVYPVIVLLIGLGSAALMLMFIVPQIGDSLSKGGLEMPAFTQALVEFGKWLRTNFLLVLLGVTIAGVLAALSRAAIGKAIGAVARRTPVLKTVLLTQEMVRFFSVMAGMSSSGVPLSDALAVGAGAVSHPQLRHDFQRLRSRLVQGGVLSRLIDEVESLPLPTRKLLVAADKAGDLESVFSGLTEDMTAELDKQTARLLAVLEPLLLLGLFVVIGTLMVSIMLPMLTLAAEQI